MARTRPRLFIVYAPDDASFVEGFLLGALNLPEDDVLLSSSLEPGAVIVEEIARGALCSTVVVVVSPAFLTSPWTQFANQLAVHHTVESANDGSTTLVPVLLADCELPLLSRFRVPLDFRDPQRERWEAEVATLRARLDAPAPAVATLPCPYPGIRPFTTENAAHFHGRDPEIADLLGRLRAGQRELYVIGPSGSGKSSLVAAGLVPRLRRTPELAGGVFLVRQLRPGADPAAALAGALDATDAERSDATMRSLTDAAARLLASQPSHHRVLLVVDQLEELFTLAEAGARAAFIAGLRVLRGHARVALVLTLRADFYAALMESTLWTDLDGQLSRLDVGPLRGDALRRAIEAPASALGVYFEPALVERLLHDVADEPGALPLLQDVLVVLWHQRIQRLLRLAEYEAMSEGSRSGVAVTVAQRANGALGGLPPVRRAIAQRVLLRLVHFGDGVTTSRRQQTRADLATADDAPEDIDAVIRHLADQRLITTSGGDDAAPAVRIDLAHEVLLSAWPVLRDWIATRRHDEQRRRALEAAAADWVSRGRGPSGLLDSDELREVRGWLTADKARELGVSEAIQALIAHSEAALAAQAAEVALRRQRWRRWVLAALVVLSGAVVAVSVLAVIAERRSVEAREQTREVQRQLARSYVSQGQALLLSDRPAQAAPYLLAAREAGTDDMSLRMLFRWAAQGVPLQRFPHGAAVKMAVWSPDGTRVATASKDGTARIWSARSGQPVTPPLVHRDEVHAVAWSPDGRRVATASKDETAQVWDAATGQRVTPPIALRSSALVVAWSPDGRRLATASEFPEGARVWDAASGRPITPALDEQGIAAVAWSPDGTRIATQSMSSSTAARIWDATSGQPVTPPLARDVRSMAWSPDGTRVVLAARESTRVWDAATGQPSTPPLRTASNLTHIDQVVWSPDGTRLATAGSDAQVWDPSSGQPITPPLVHPRRVHRVAWSPDGTRLATAGEDGTARVWDTDSGQPTTLPFAHQQINHVAWSPDGTRLATASEDGRAYVWDAASEQVAVRVLKHFLPVHAVAWSPDGTRLATAGDEVRARVWDAASGELVTLLEHQHDVLAVAWSPDGTRVATASSDHTARAWDASSGESVTPPLEHGGPVQAVAWSPDGTRLAAASEDGTARVWNASSGEPVTPPLAHGGDVIAVAWAPDGTRVATASSVGTVRIWSALSGELAMPPLTHDYPVGAVAWSPEGKRIAAASLGNRIATATVNTAGRTAQIWDAASGQPSTPALAHRENIRVVAWSPDGTRVATAGGDEARVWSAGDGQPVTPLLAHPARVNAVAWSPDGTRVATASDDQTVRVWDASSGQQLTPPRRHDASVTAVAWSPDGKRLATASQDATARIWEVASDTGTLADWRAVVERGDYRLNRAGVLIAREPTTPPAASPPAARSTDDPD